MKLVNVDSTEYHEVLLYVNKHFSILDREKIEIILYDKYIECRDLYYVLVDLMEARHQVLSVPDFHLNKSRNRPEALFQKTMTK